MPSAICKSCGVKKANRPGPMCYGCWVNMGQPTAEEAKGLRERQAREAAEREAAPPVSEIKADEKVLSTEIEPDLTAMQWAASHAPGDERTWQQRRMREFMEKNPNAFWARLAKLQDADPGEGSGERSPVPTYDGSGPCPVCGHEKEKPIEDEGTKKILAMLDELDAKGAA